MNHRSFSNSLSGKRIENAGAVNEASEAAAANKGDGHLSLVPEDFMYLLTHFKKRRSSGGRRPPRERGESEPTSGMALSGSSGAAGEGAKPQSSGSSNK